MTQSSDLASFQPDWYINAPDEQQEQFRNWLQNLLDTTFPVTITFTKADNTTRVMRCTTDGKIIPPLTQQARDDINRCTVWDVDKLDWRSFKYENITDIQFKLAD
jgi:hypothetical protein